MIRFLSFLFNKPYEPCKSCQILKEQLEFERADKKEVMNTLLSILQPKAFEAVTTELEPMLPKATTFSKRRAALEQRDRLEAQLKQSSPFIGKKDEDKDIAIATSIDNLEQELSIGEKNG